MNRLLHNIAVAWTVLSVVFCASPIAQGEVNSKPQMLPTPVPKGETLVRVVSGTFVASIPELQLAVWSQEPDGVGILRVLVRQSDTQIWRCLAEAHYAHINDLQVGPVLGDGRDQIVLGVFQRSKLDIRKANRLYVYSVDAKTGLIPQWRGSGLSRPFGRFWLLPSAGRCDIVALEKDKLPEDKGYYWLSVYAWNGFGVHRLWNTPVPGSVQSLSTGRDHYGSYITFVQMESGSRHKLILRPQETPGTEDDLTFIARIDTYP